MITDREKGELLAKESQVTSRVQSPPDNIACGNVLPATLANVPSPTPATERDETEHANHAADSAPVAEQPDSKELNSEHRHSPRQPADQQSRTILSKKSGQITFDITRSDPTEPEQAHASA